MPAALRFKPLDLSLLAPSSALQIGAKAVAALARQAIAEAEASNAAALGHPVAMTSFVNGTPSDAFETIKPGQSIVAVFDLGSDLLGWIFDQLRLHAPVRSGRFRDSILVYADGEQVDGIDGTLAAEEVIFTSLVPYARKIEGDLDKGRSPQSGKAPNGVFQAVAVMAQQRYGNQADIRFTYREPTGGANDLEAWARKHSARTAGANARRHQYRRDVRQPAVVVTLR